jgi:hypothetical protein
MDSKKTICQGLTTCHESRPIAIIVTVGSIHSVWLQISDAYSVRILTPQRPPQRNILSKTVVEMMRLTTLTSMAPTTSDNYCAQLSIFPQNLSARGKAS